MSLNEEEHQKLFSWLLKEAEKINLIDLDPSVFANYVRSLVIRNVSKGKIAKGLFDFLGKNKAKIFANELKRRIKEKDFSIQSINEEDIQEKVEENQISQEEEENNEKIDNENIAESQSSDYSDSTETDSDINEEEDDEKDEGISTKDKELERNTFPNVINGYGRYI